MPALVLALALLPAPAAAFCGFYVGGAGAELYNDATLVVLMREGTRTVLSMQNTYSGPPEDFAMIVPVPAGIRERDVKVLPADIFERVDRLAAPRLVAYAESDPCGHGPYDILEEDASAVSSIGRSRRVTIEAEFAVGEYDIVVLSSRDSDALESWLHDEGYAIPQGASAVLRPYVEAGTRFFVAKVDVGRARTIGGRVVLSPLRVSYDSSEFSLPIRLGLLNTSGEQDLLVHILARGTRYAVANHPNVAIPTNLVVDEQVAADFPGFYRALYASTVAQAPGAVVTEYAWDASNCDPCPGPTLSPVDLATLGADVVGHADETSWVLTRLHYRYTADTLGEDLVFRRAGGLEGGRGMPDDEGHLDEATRPSSSNQFQGRYAVLSWWQGEIACDNPHRGWWESRVVGSFPAAVYAQGAVSPGVAPTAVALAADDIVGPSAGGGPDRAQGCGRCAVGRAADPRGGFAPWALTLLGLVGVARQRVRARRDPCRAPADRSRHQPTQGRSRPARS